MNDYQDLLTTTTTCNGNKGLTGAGTGAGTGSLLFRDIKVALGQCMKDIDEYNKCINEVLVVYDRAELSRLNISLATPIPNTSTQYTPATPNTSKSNMSSSNDDVAATDVLNNSSDIDHTTNTATNNNGYTSNSNLSKITRPMESLARGLLGEPVSALVCALRLCRARLEGLRDASEVSAERVRGLLVGRAG